MVYKGLILVSILFLTACSTTPPMSYSNTSSASEPINRVYFANYDYTWNAALKELQRFSLKLANKDSGIIITEDMTGYSTGVIRSQFRFYFDARVETAVRSAGYRGALTTINGYRVSNKNMFEITRFRITHTMNIDGFAWTINSAYPAQPVKATK